jgi:SAM-dependent methyltransferase
MDRTMGQLRLYAGEEHFTVEADTLDVLSPSEPPVLNAYPNPVELANRELIRPAGHSRSVPGLLPFTSAWYDELEQKRYQRHGTWLISALEFGRHPGESLLLLGPGLGSDAVRYARSGTPVTVGLSATDFPGPVRENLARRLLPIRAVNITGDTLPFSDGAFDVVTWNALHEPKLPDSGRISELFRVLKAGGKVIGLFPAWYDAGYWQDLLLPLQWIYWKRPTDPATGAKITARQLRHLFGQFQGLRFAKRHLRRSELPHPWRILPLIFLERLIGRVLVLKAFKPLSARTSPSLPLAA